MSWRRSPAVLPATIGVAATLVLALLVAFWLWVTGDAKAVSDNAAIIGALVALGGVFTAQMVSIALEEQRRQESRELETQRAREASLQNYFEQVGSLLIEKPLSRASPGDNLSTVVQAQTLAVLKGLDPDRKGILLNFLYESGLVYSHGKAVFHLYAADLRGANLQGSKLHYIDLVHAYLTAANLKEANLSGALLIEADLRRAFLDKAILFQTYLTAANLKEASLQEANLSWAYLTHADLKHADLKHADLAHADLKHADLTGADMTGADLAHADLKHADLTGADMTWADLIHADLSFAKGITNAELVGQALSLVGTIMPDRSKHS